MKIIKAFPPNYAQIIKVFPGVVRTPGVMFCYADVIYSPYAHVTPSLMAHEKVHAARQKITSPEEWWKQYLEDTEFRFVEELLAHQVEYHARVTQGNRHERRGALIQIAGRLASPLYGSMTTRAIAKKLIAGDTLQAIKRAKKVATVAEAIAP